MSTDPKKKKLILIVTCALDVGGTEQHLLRVMPEVAKQQINIMIYTTSHPGKLAARMQHSGVPVIAPPLYKFFNRIGRLGKYPGYLASFVKLAWLIRQLKPHLVHCFLPGATVLGGYAAQFAGCRNLVMSRRTTYRNSVERAGKLFVFEKKLYKKMPVVLACSEVVKENLLEDGVPEEKIKVIYNGIDIGQYELLPDRSEARHWLKIPKESFVLCVVANLFECKGHIDLLRALARIKDKLPDNWCLLCAGRDAGELAYLQQQTQKLGLTNNIRWLGARSDVKTILAATDVGVLCSHIEGFSNALLECMAAGLPMVVTEVGGSDEAVIHGENGLVVPIADTKKIAESILRLADSKPLRQQMSIKARAILQEKFTLQHLVDNYHHFYTTSMEAFASVRQHA